MLIAAMSCPLEKQMMSILEAHGIEYRRPDMDQRVPTNLDFYLVDFNIYIEVKRFHSERIGRQLAEVPPQATAILLMGPNAVKDFERLCKALV